MLVSKNFITVFVMGLTGLLACQENTSHRRLKPELFQGASVLPNQTKTEVPLSHLFDKNFDFTPGDKLTAQDLAYRFPIHQKDGSEAAFLTTGQETLSARLQLLDQVTRSVRVQSLVLWGDETGYAIGQKLIELADEGKNVSVIIDPLSNLLPRDRKLYYQLRRHGIDILGYELLYLNVINTAVSRNIIAKIRNANMHFHEKLMVIDGEIPEQAMAIIGGSNLSNEYYKVETKNTRKVYSDQDVILRGPIVGDLTKSFDENKTEFLAYRQSLGNTDFIWEILDKKLDEQGELEAKLDPEIVNLINEISQKPLELNWHEVSSRFIKSRPRFNEDILYPAHINLIKNAKAEILISNPWLIADDDFYLELLNAAKRQVKIKILTNGVSVMKEFPMLAIESRSRYVKFLKKAGEVPSSKPIELFEWSGDALLDNGLGQNHAKLMVVDGRYSLVGSYNMDPRSRYLNTESVVVLDSLGLGAELAAQIKLNMTAAFSLPITPEQALAYKNPETPLDIILLYLSHAIANFL